MRSGPRFADATGHGTVLSVGAYRPRRVVGNAEICRAIDSTEQWIESRSGIRSRRFAEPDETLPVMGTAAAQAPACRAGLSVLEVDCVIACSMSNLVQTPPLAVQIAHRLGAVNAGAFDVSGACAGFCHGVAVAGNMVRLGEARHVLVVGVERMTDIVDPADRSIAFLFADGAGAVLVGPADRPGLSPTIRGADGTSLDALRMTTSWGDFRADPGLPLPMMRMDGRRVFRWALEHLVPAARTTLDAAGVDVAELAAFVPHQANLRMIELLAAELKLPPDAVVARDVAEAGNTSAASIPLALDRLLLDEPGLTGRPALLIGFGAGLNYAAQVVRLP